MIAEFRCEDTRRIFEGEQSPVFPPEVQPAARRKLRMLNAAINLNDLRSPPGNHLEKLTGDREGKHSIRVNDQYRVCFAWREGNAYEVEIVDYH